jgi:hypothetical protein
LLVPEEVAIDPELGRDGSGWSLVSLDAGECVEQTVYVTIGLLRAPTLPCVAVAFIDSKMNTRAIRGRSHSYWQGLNGDRGGTGAPFMRALFMDFPNAKTSSREPRCYRRGALEYRTIPPSST